MLEPSPNAKMEKRVSELSRVKKNFGDELYSAAIDVGMIGGLTKAERVSALEWACRTNGAYLKDNRAFLDGRMEAGLEEGRRRAGRAVEEDLPGPRPNGGTTLEIMPASAFKMRALEWFWKDRLPLGKFSLIGGLPDKGKGLLTCFLSACATAGIPFPMDEGCAPQGNVIILSGEDDPNDTIAPRLKSAGADLERVHIVRSTREKDGRRRVFSLLTDLEALRAAIEKISDVVLVIIDPLSAYQGVGKVNSSSASDVRGFLQPFCDLAAEKKFVFLGVTHLNKKSDVGNAMLRFSDSLAYVALARSVYMAAEDPEDHNRRVFARVKGNLGPDKKALSFMTGVRLMGTDEDSGKEIEAPYLEWGHRYVEVTANEAMQAESGGASGRAERREAKDFLLDRLSAGPVPQNELIAEAEAAGITKATLNRAKKDLNVKSRKGKGLDQAWTWELPNG